MERKEAMVHTRIRTVMVIILATTLALFPIYSGYLSKYITAQMGVVVDITREVNVKEDYVVLGDVKVYFKGL